MSRLVGLCLLSSVSHHKLWVMMEGNLSILTNMMHHRWTWVEMLFSYNRRRILASRHWLLRGRQLSGASTVIFLLRELNTQGPFNFCPMAHMMSPALQMLHCSLLGSCNVDRHEQWHVYSWGWCCCISKMRQPGYDLTACQGFRCIWCGSLVSIWSFLSMFVHILPCPYALCMGHSCSQPEHQPARHNAGENEHLLWWQTYCLSLPDSPLLVLIVACCWSWLADSAVVHPGSIPVDPPHPS